MHPELKPFSVDITHVDMDKFQKVMDKLADETNDYIAKLATELGITQECASDVWYLRTRSRWTQELENELIRLHRAGTPPNVFDFPGNG